jgi:hypothetical protein
MNVSIYTTLQNRIQLAHFVPSLMIHSGRTLSISMVDLCHCNDFNRWAKHCLEWKFTKWCQVRSYLNGFNCSFSALWVMDSTSHVQPLWIENFGNLFYLPRFSCVVMFLPQSKKKCIQNLFFYFGFKCLCYVPSWIKIVPNLIELYPIFSSEMSEFLLQTFITQFKKSTLDSNGNQTINSDNLQTAIKSFKQS